MSQNTAVATRQSGAVTTLKQLVEAPAYSARFKEILKDRAPQFVASLIQVGSSQALRNCDPHTVVAAAITAAALDLPIDKNLGFAHIVPYKGQAQFQIGYKGSIQLAIRTGQYRFLNACEVHEGELVSFNKLTGEIDIDPSKKKSDEVVGYAAYFKLVNGYEHAVYWTKEEVEAHAKRYSQAYRSAYDTPWKSDFDSMALKTVIKDLISHWGIMSVQMQKAFSEDQSVKSDMDADPTYPDNMKPAKAVINAPPAEVVTDTPPTEENPDGDLGPQTEKAEPVEAQVEVETQGRGKNAKPAKAEVAPVETKELTPPNPDDEPDAQLRHLLSQRGLTEAQYAAWHKAKYKLPTEPTTIAEVYEVSPARVGKIAREWSTFEAEIVAASKK